MRRQERELEMLIAWARMYGWHELRRTKHIVLAHVSGAQYVLAKTPRGGERTRRHAMERLKRISELANYPPQGESQCAPLIRQSKMNLPKK